MELWRPFGDSDNLLSYNAAPAIGAMPIAENQVPVMDCPSSLTPLKRFCSRFNVYLTLRACGAILSNLLAQGRRAKPFLSMPINAKKSSQGLDKLTWNEDAVGNEPQASAAISPVWAARATSKPRSLVVRSDACRRGRGSQLERLNGWG